MMNRRSLFKAATAALLLFSTTIATPDFRTVDEDTELGKHMKAINTALKPMRKSLKDPAQNAKNLGKVLEMQTHALAAKALNPAMMAKMPEAEHAKFLIEYRVGMHEFLDVMFEMEIALMKNDNKAAQASYTKLKKTKSGAHKSFKPKKKKK